jgi:tetratricopeptide (TPR) repeat protein
MNQTMNRKKIKLVVLSFIVGFVFQNHSWATDQIIAHPNSEKLLNELNIARDLKQKKHDHFEINKWNPSYRKLLKENGKNWLTIHRQAKDSLVKYLARLTAAYVHLPENHPLFQKVKEELIAQHPEHNKKKLTESYHNQLSLISNACHPELIKGRIHPKKASFLTKLLKPTGRIKFEDRMHFIGIPAEPQQWSIQADYSMAQLRAGNTYTARKENEKLLKKSTKLSEGKGRGLNYRIEGNVRTYKSLNREFLIHRALIEAHAKKHQEAKELLSKALEMHEVDEIKKSQSFIVREIESLIKSSEK